MASNSDSPNPNMDAFLQDGIEQLPQNHYVQTSTECSICHEPTVLDPTVSQAIIKIKLCNHIYHQHCLVAWLQSLGLSRPGTCPTDRHVLYAASGAMVLGEEVQNMIRDFAALHEALDNLMASIHPEILGADDEPSGDPRPTWEELEAEATPADMSASMEEAATRDEVLRGIGTCQTPSDSTVPGTSFPAFGHPADNTVD